MEAGGSYTYYFGSGLNWVSEIGSRQGKIFPHIKGENEEISCTVQYEEPDRPMGGLGSHMLWVL